MTGIKIIEAGDEHVKAIVDLWDELMSFHAALYPFYATTVDARERFEGFLRQNIASPEGLVLVAAEGAAVVGYCLCFVAHHPPVLKRQRHGFVSDLAVTESRRGRGFGTMLVGRVRQWFAGRGISRIELRASAFNAAGKSFWEKQGFTEYEKVMYRDDDA